MKGRPPIPRRISREILIEAGHRCAIQTCRSTANIEIHHIVPWEKCQNHNSSNLIALCPNCHKLADTGKIDRQSLFRYKKICQKLVQTQPRHIETETRIKFNPNEPLDILEARNILYLVDNGPLKFAFGFAVPFSDKTYVVEALGNGVVGLTVLAQEKNSILLEFKEPCPSIVRLEFKS